MSVEAVMAEINALSPAERREVYELLADRFDPPPPGPTPEQLVEQERELDEERAKWAPTRS